MQKLKNWPNYFKFDIIKATLPIDVPKNDFLKEDSMAIWLPNDDYVLLSVSINFSFALPFDNIIWNLIDTSNYPGITTQSTGDCTRSSN